MNLRPNDPSLLGRAELCTDDDSWDTVRGKTVLITGAGGSLGRMIACSLAAIEDTSLVLLDHHEYSLYELQRLLDSAPPGNRSFVLADIRDRDRIETTLVDSRPDLILHLAAYKHVHFGEMFPTETVAVNVLATQILIQLASQLGVSGLVYPSSDKAVEPPSLYGATKRICEAMIFAAAAEGHSFTALRYMNVLGTRGSVLETWAGQIALGHPLTVTDARMTRYWISPREAVWLALHASRASGGSLLMLDVTDEISVMEMARRFAGQLGASGETYPIVVTGSRPGERLREVLIGPREHATPGPVAGIVTIADDRRAEHVARIPSLVADLEGHVRAGDNALIKEATMRAARTLR